MQRLSVQFHLAADDAGDIQQVVDEPGKNAGLFEDGRKVDLRLIEASPVNSGVVALVYQPASSK